MADEVKESSSSSLHKGKLELEDAKVVGYELARTALLTASEHGYLDLSTIHRILDFGSGLGGPTLAIIDTTKPYKPHIDAIERQQIFVQLSSQLGILPSENIIHGNGIEYLKQFSQSGIVPYDLITAFRLGPDPQGRIFREIAASTITSLTP